MAKLCIAGVSLGLLGGALIIVLISGPANMTAITMSDLMGSLVWVLPPILLIDIFAGYLSSKPLFELESVMKRGEAPDSELAQRAWRTGFRMPYYSSITSGFCWVLGVGGVSLWMYYLSEFSLFDTLIMAAIGLVVGPITSIDFFFVARRLAAPYIQIASKYIDDPKPPQFWRLWTKIVFGMTYLLVGSQVITMVVGYYQTKSLLADQVMERMSQSFIEIERDLKEGRDVDGVLARQGISNPELKFYRISTDGRVEPPDETGDLAAMLGRFGRIQTGDIQPGHIDYLYPFWEKVFPWQKGDFLLWNGKILLIKSFDGGKLVGLTNIDNMLWNWGVLQGAWFRNAAYLILGMLLATGLAILLALDVTRPLDMLREAARRVGRGEKDYRVGSLGDDEIGELAMAFDSMSASIQQQFVQMEGLLARVADAIMRLGNTSDQLKKISQEQSAGASEQAAAIQQALTTSEEISATARQISETAKGVEEAADQTTGACGSGMEDVGSAHEGMEAIKRQMQDIADHMVELGEHSDQIGAILQMISEISEETNLLSLNAAIEAAGAGEAGERFSVVAGEVRSLAERTQESTARIQELTDQLRNSIGKAVMTAEVGEKTVRAGYDRMQAAKSSFENITQYAEGTARASKEISISSSQQTSASDELTGSISEVHEVSRAFLSSAQQMEKAIVDLGELSKGLEALLTDLKQ